MNTDLFGEPLDQKAPEPPPKPVKRGFNPVEVPSVPYIPCVCIREGNVTTVWNLPRPGYVSIYD